MSYLLRVPLDMAGLVVKLSDSSLLYDTKKISYGLVKSGYLSYVENWRRLRLRGVNLDPDIGSSWVEQGVPGDDQFGFSIESALSPIVFLVGPGVATGVKVSGNTKTYLFAGASTTTKYYCFDLMRDDSLSGPKLKTRKEQSGDISFNSNQLPLNIHRSIVAPQPGTLDRFGRPVTAYAGGRNQRISYQTASGVAKVHSLVDIPIDAGVEYAAFLPWSRSCGIVDAEAYAGGGADIYGMAEGAFGIVGGISFIFAPPGRTTQDAWPAQGTTASPSFHLLPTDRFPSALVIKTSGLPFPFN